MNDLEVPEGCTQKTCGPDGEARAVYPVTPPLRLARQQRRLGVVVGHAALLSTFAIALES
jgi:hypothetical protein